MPNLDGGHYFFTALVPILTDRIVEHGTGAGALRSSPVHMVREALETLPTALQSRETEAIGIQSPFARSLRTHFVRFVVLDQPFYNGRDHGDAIVAAIRNTDLLQAQPLDVLSCPYLFVMIDFDPGNAAGEPRAYLQELWTLAKDELTDVFRYCYGFPAVNDPRSFADFLLPCQVETTMPFNDYWIGAPPLTSLSKALLVAPPAIGVALPLLAALFHIVGWRLGLCLSLLLGLAGLAVDYVLVMRRGAQPFPAAPNSTLRDVLKALYLQQAFTRFAMQQQGTEPAALAAAFRDFLIRNRPHDLDGPTQRPGVIRSRFEGTTA